MANFSDPVWWFEVWVHFVFICSAASYALAPLEEWSQENCEPSTFRKIHSFVQLIQKYGALNKRSNLGQFSLAEMKIDQKKDDAVQAAKDAPSTTPPDAGK